MCNSVVYFLLALSIIYLAQCQPTTRLAGGTVAEISKYPFSAALLTNSGFSVYLQSCGGVILTSNTVLSVASCFYNTQSQAQDPVNSWRVRVGSSAADAGGTVHYVQKILEHESFIYDTRENDIAVLKLSIAVTYAPTLVSSAVIAGSGFVLNNYQRVNAIGWGTMGENGMSSPELRETDIWVVDNDICKSRYSEIGFNVNQDMVCVGWLDVGVRGQCQGDYGSPVLQDGIVVGLYSWSEGCANFRYPGINTRISSYTSWIVSSVNEI